MIKNRNFPSNNAYFAEEETLSFELTRADYEVLELAMSGEGGKFNDFDYKKYLLMDYSYGKRIEFYEYLQFGKDTIKMSSYFIMIPSKLDNEYYKFLLFINRNVSTPLKILQLSYDEAYDETHLSLLKL